MFGTLLIVREHILKWSLNFPHLLYFVSPILSNMAIPNYKTIIVGNGNALAKSENE